MKYIKIIQDGEHVGKPLHTVVNKKSGSPIAQLFWYPAWKQWVCRFNPDSIWSHDCLADIREELVRLNGVAR